MNHTFPETRRESAQPVSTATRFPGGARRWAGQASRHNLIAIPSAPGRPPRHRCRRQRVHRPAGRSVWEDILPGEIRRGPLENLHLKLSSTLIPPQLRELFFLDAGQARLTPAPVGVGLGTQFPRHDSEIRRSFTTSNIGLVRLRASSMARRRNSAGWAGSTATSFLVAKTTSGQVSVLRGEAHCTCVGAWLSSVAVECRQVHPSPRQVCGTALCLPCSSTNCADTSSTMQARAPRVGVPRREGRHIASG